MSNKRKQFALDLDQKIVIINDIKAGKKQAAVAAACGLSKQTINSIWQKREKLRQAFESRAVCVIKCTAALTLFVQFSDNTDLG